MLYSYICLDRADDFMHGPGYISSYYGIGKCTFYSRCICCIIPLGSIFKEINISLIIRSKSKFLTFLAHHEQLGCALKGLFVYQAIFRFV